MGSLDGAEVEVPDLETVSDEVKVVRIVHRPGVNVIKPFSSFVTEEGAKKPQRFVTGEPWSSLHSWEF